MPLLVSYLISLFVFGSLVYLFLYLPGYLLLKKFRFAEEPFSTLTLSLSLGIILFVSLHLVLGFTGLRFASWPFYLGLAYLLFRDKKEWVAAASCWRPAHWQIDRKGWFKLVLVIGFLAQVWINIFSGWQYADGIRFWSAHGHDGVWHGGLMRELAVRFPPRLRLMSGSKLENYHYFVDILMGEFHRLGGFDPLDLYFRHFTFLFAFLFLALGFIFVRRWRGEKAGIWAMFFMALSGSFGYLVRLIQTGTILNSEAAFWVSQTYTAIGNPPQIAAFILFITFLYFLFEWLKAPTKRVFFFLVFLSGLMPGFKVYASATLLGGLGLLGMYRLLIEKEVRTLVLFAACAAAGSVTFLANTTGGGSFLVWQPWWFVRTMVVSGDRLGWSDLEMRRQFYLAQGGVRGWLRVAHMELMAGLIFAVGNLGTKALGFLEVARSVWTTQKKRTTDIFLIFTAAVCFIFPHLFVQRGVAWNTCQFFQYYVLILGFFAGVWMSTWTAEKRFLQKVTGILGLIAFSIPTVAASWIFFAPGNALALVSNEELEGLAYLEQTTDPGAVIGVSPFDRWAWEQFPEQPRPIHTWDDSGYVSYYANRETYMADEGQVEIMGYAAGKTRAAEMKEIYVGDWDYNRGYSPFDAREFFSRAGIDYLYLVYHQKLRFAPQEMGLEQVFANGVVTIYKVNPL